MKATFLALTAALLLPAAATAASPYYIPPGNSAVNQYAESVQSAGGNGSTTVFTPQGGAASTGPSVSQTPAVGTQNRQSGQPGAQPTAPVTASPRHPSRRGSGGVFPSGNGGSTGGPAGGLPAGSSPLPKVLSAVTGFGTQDGLGTALPVALLVATAALAVIALRRRRLG